MKFPYNIHIAIILSAILFSSCAAQETVRERKIIAQPAQQTKIPQDNTLSKVQLPKAEREFRAAWIATVANINWPSRNNLTTEQQKQEAITILDMLQEAHFNAVVFQARPSADAFYKSELEPWSYFLTGNIGKAPNHFYDPLEFWISEAHKRGMQLHVWLNPYRAHHTTGGAVTGESMAKKMSEATYKLRNGMYWMDPSDDKVQDHVSSVIKDIVKRYDIDAIHIDDYFYPYKEYNGGRDFPDQRTWNAYLKVGGTLSKADWRRANVNKFIKRIHEEIKAEKPQVKFGISPFGIWKPGFPAGITGSSQYDELYADAKLWLNEGWCDYYAPQLYWKEDGPQSFSALLKWWESENVKNIHLWPGLNTVGIKNVPDRPAEIIKQIKITRNVLPESKGVIHYSMDGISKSPAMLKALKEIYKEKALVPASPWIKTKPLTKPQLTLQQAGNEVHLRWSSSETPEVFKWILYSKYGNDWQYEILERSEVSKNLEFSQSGKKLNAVAVKAVDRLGNESEYDAKAIR